MYFGFEYEALRVYEQVALPAPNLLAAVVSPLLSSYAGGFRGLRVHNASARLQISARTDPQDLAQGGVKALPSTVDAPLPEPVVDAFPRREVLRQ